MASALEVREEVWTVVEPLVPPVKTPEKRGHRPVPDRVALSAIVFVLVTGPRGRIFCASSAVRGRRRGGGCGTGRRLASGSAYTPRCLTS